MVNYYYLGKGYSGAFQRRLPSTYGRDLWYEASAPRLHPLKDRKQNNVWEINRPKKSELHPTQKSIELVIRAIKNSSNMKDVILDLFGGSGTTLIASEETERQCRMMELDPKYCDVIVKRYIQSKRSSDEVFLVRDSGIIPYIDIVNDEELNDGM